MTRIFERNIVGALSLLRPDESFTATSISDDLQADYEAVIWHANTPMPSFAEVEAKVGEIPSVEDQLAATEYQRLRAPEYPPLADLADAVYWSEQGDSSHLEAYVAACEAVKSKYPKPD